MVRKRTRASSGKSQASEEPQRQAGEGLVNGQDEVEPEGAEYIEGQVSAEEQVDVEGEEAPIAVDDDEPPLLMPQKEPLEEGAYVTIEEVSHIVLLTPSPCPSSTIPVLSLV